MRETDIRIGILTVSDRASRGEYEDVSGPAIIKWLRERLTSEWKAEYSVIPDERSRIEDELIRMADDEKCCLVITSGGTGPALRDVTPDATEAVCGKMLPGFGERMRMVSFQYVPTAVLSRQAAGIRRETLIINLPGNPKAISECLEAIFPAVPDCIDLIGGARLECDESLIRIFRHN